MSLLGIAFVCFLIVLILEPKVIGALLYWGFILLVGFVAFWALVFWSMG
jgi:hypothetical protein